MSEKNKLIKSMLSKDICSKNLFEMFALFANRLCHFSEVLDVAESEGVNFKELVENEGLDYEAIKRCE